MSRERSAALVAIDGLREPYRVIAFEAEALEVEVVDERLRDLTASILRKADADLALAIVG